MVTTAVFLAISLILRFSASGYIPLFGAHGARVGIHGVFTILPAILFGPWYGAVASGLGDMLGHFIRPTPGEAWLWQITVIMTVGGFIRGWVWRLLRGRGKTGLRAVVVAMTVLFLAFGSFSMIQLRLGGITRGFYDGIEDPRAIDTSEMNFMSRMVIARTQNTGNPARNLSDRIFETTYAPIGASVLGLIILGVDLILSKKIKPEVIPGSGVFAPWNGSIMPIALTVILVSLLINTANSIQLWFTITAWRGFPFMYIWLPRAVVSLLNSTVNVFIAALLLGVCYKQPHMRAIIDAGGSAQDHSPKSGDGDF